MTLYANDKRSELTIFNLLKCILYDVQVLHTHFRFYCSVLFSIAKLRDNTSTDCLTSLAQGKPKSYF